MSASTATARAARRIPSTLAWVAFALAVLISLTVGCAADVLDAPLCGEVHGFADEFHDHIHIPIDNGSSAQEAIVLIARAFPLHPEDQTLNWLVLNVTFVTSPGVKVNRMSDDTGVAVLTQLARGSSLEVRLQKRRHDSPVPFRFFSLPANKPGCSVAVSPDNSFIAPLPRWISVPDTAGKHVPGPATFYFKTTLSKESNAATVSITVVKGGVQKFHVLSGDTWAEHLSGDALVTDYGGIIIYSYTPEETGEGAYAHVTITVQEGGGSGGTTQANGPTTPGDEDPKAKKSSSILGSFFKTVVTIGLIALAVYFVARTYYNVRVRHIHDFPEMIPFIDFFRACFLTAQLCFARLTGRTTGEASREYESLDNQDFYK